MRYPITADVNKSFIACGRQRLRFSALLEELIDNSLKWEAKLSSNVTIKILPMSDGNENYKIVEYQDDSDGIRKEDLPDRIAIGCQGEQKDLHAHGMGLSTVVSVLQETYKITDWTIKTGNCIANGPVTSSIDIVDDPRGNTGFYMKFKFPTSNLIQESAHKNSTSIIKSVEGLCGTFGFKYRLYLQSKLLNLNIVHQDGSRRVKAVIPSFIPYGNYPINMPDGRRHAVKFGLFNSLNKDEDIPDLFVSKTSDKGYYAIFNGKVLGLLKLEDIFDKSDYNTGQVYNFKQWYGEIELDSRTSGSITNAIKDGLNEQTPEVQYIMNAIRTHIDVSTKDDRNDLKVFLDINPTEGKVKKRLRQVFNATYGKTGWEVVTEFQPVKLNGLAPVRIDIITYHPKNHEVTFYELKKDMFDVNAVVQFAGYKTVIENAIRTVREDPDNSSFISDTLKQIASYDELKISYVALCNRSSLTEEARILIDTTPEFQFFTIEDYKEYFS